MTPPTTTPPPSYSEACATTAKQLDASLQPASDCGSREVVSALERSTVLVAGAAGLVGTQLLHRLLSPPFEAAVKQVIAIIRATNSREAADKLPEFLKFETFYKHPSSAAAKLIVLYGDCSKPNLGLDDDDLKTAQQATIVINAAADTRFMRPLSDALSGVTDISYMTSRFSLTAPNVKTHIHLSTTFVGWILENGSTVYEDAHISQPEATCTQHEHETHANTYLQAKALGERCVNSLLQPQLGQPCHGKAVRILRLGILGPALSFPRPGWGVQFNSSPISALIAMEKVSSGALDLFVPKNAVLDVLPVDLAVNQILALTAAAHRTHHLPSSNPAHPAHTDNPVNRHNIAIPCYNIASGMSVSQQVRVREIAGTEVSSEHKLDRPFIPSIRMLEVYSPFIEKVLKFDTVRVHRVLDISPMPLEEEESEAPTGDKPNAPEMKGDANMNSETLATEIVSMNLDSPSTNLRTHTQTHNTNRMHHPGNLSPSWSDPAIDCGDLQVNCAKAIAAVGGWAGYLRSARDEMEKRLQHAHDEHESESHDMDGKATMNMAMDRKWEKYVD